LLVRTHLVLLVAAILPATSARADTFGDTDGFWTDPISRAAAYVSAVHEDDRPYSTAIHPRDIDGAVATSCEHAEGQPCGDGVGTFGELDSTAGYGDIASAAIRLRLRSGDSGYRDSYESGVDLDRAHVNAVFGPFSLEVGRDVLSVGPRSHTQLGWGDNAPPLDQVRLSTAHPLELTDSVHAEGLYVLGRLRDPQTYPGDVVSIVRGQLDFGTRAQVGLMEMVQMEGTGAPHLGVWDFILEHFERHDLSGSATDSSNRRFGGDANIRIDGFGGGRIYYQLMFEDIRAAYWYDALHYDADHLLGVELPVFNGLTVELQKTGFRSQEHTPRVTGFTTEARTPGSPLGPDAQALYATAHWGNVAPWIELVRLSSDTYHQITHGPIVNDSTGIPEYRYRLGARVVVPLRPHTWIESSPFVEHVENFSFVSGAQRENIGITAALVWQPR
jgi:hypothetical protein